jgi:Domain of unknown function (DUF1906)
MLRSFLQIGATALLLTSGCAAFAQRSYLGFDRNGYPGDAALPALRKTFHYTGYWLNNPPGEMQNTWTGKRGILKQNGFGFLVLFTGRSYAELKGNDAAALGRADGKAATDSAAREGFARNVLIFLDQEEGGGLLAEQAAYLFAWIDAVRAAGARAGVYCSGIRVPDGSGTISTAQDIAQKLAAKASASSKGKSAEHDRVAIWIANDQCPPSPGCTVDSPPMGALYSPAGPVYTAVWQYAQSPRRMQFSAACPQNQAPDGNCYAPGLAQGPNSFVDLDTADSPDPSEAQ